MKRASPGNSLCRERGSSEEFGRIIREQSCAFSLSSILRWFDALCSGGSRGEASPRAPTGGIFTALLLKVVLLCGKGGSRDCFVGKKQGGLSARLCAARPSLSTDDAEVLMNSQRFGAGSQALLICSRFCSWNQGSGLLLKVFSRDDQPRECKG